MNEKKFFITSDIRRATYIWNFIYSLIFAFQSVFILIILTRTVGIEDAGMFTIAYANASLFLLGEKYGVRNYQISDVKNEHNFNDYLFHRLISIIFMSLFEFFYILRCSYLKDYSVKKITVMILVCALKISDAIEDVYAGEFQKNGRLDIAAKMMAVRLMLSTTVMMLAAVVFDNLIIAVGASFGLSVILVTVELLWSKEFVNTGKCSILSIRQIFIRCFPLFSGTFLNQYINNAPKYAIDGALSHELQAYYGFIAMPIFIIGLLNNVIFAPVIHGLAKNWYLHQNKIFLNNLFKQLLVVVGITIFALAGGYILGIPVLSLLYNTDLSEYKKELLVLLLGGGFLAVSGVLNTVITIMRWQKYLLFGYLLIAVTALLGCRPIVLMYGIPGVSLFYMVLMFFMSLVFGIIFFIGYKKNAV